MYGIESYDLGGVAAIIADISHCGEVLLTSTAWKCKQFGAAGPPTGWLTADFDGVCF